ncbi:MAG: 30S ribosomal protein S3 [Parcubacteria group bacterium]|nr:30S ribosomal protein S3 [Parcubacteria group bacterium]
MGHKVNPKGYRVSVIYGWPSKWFSKRNYAENLKQDIQIRRFLKNKLREALLDTLEIERSHNKITVIIHAAKPGVIIGKGGAGVEELKKTLERTFLVGKKLNLQLTISEVKKPNLSSAIVMQGMIFDIEKRMPFRRVLKQALGKIEKAGALGGRVSVSGRLNGAEIARRETLSFGKVPLHTLRADIDYNRGMAKTTYGAIGVKVWVYRGEVFGEKKVLNMKNETNEVKNQALKS